MCRGPYIILKTEQTLGRRNYVLLLVLLTHSKGKLLIWTHKCLIAHAFSSYVFPYTPIFTVTGCCKDFPMKVKAYLTSTHYNDVIMTTAASQITSLTVVYSTVYSEADQRKHQSSASLAFVRGIHRDRWIPRTKGQLRGKCFHLMTSSWIDAMAANFLATLWHQH